MVMRKGMWGGPRIGAGRKGSPPDQVRSKKLLISLTRVDLAKLKRLAAKQEMPPSTLAYQFIVRALKRRK